MCGISHSVLQNDLHHAVLYAFFAILITGDLKNYFIFMPVVVLRS